MKQISKKMLMFIIGLMTYMNIFAIYPYDFEVDGIYYVVYNLEKRTCCVVPGDNNYSGELVIPETVTYKDRQFTVVAIASFAFDNCDNLTSISIPNCVTEIYEDGFWGCNSLESVTLPNSVTYIGNSAFGNCESLTSVTIPNSVITIDNYAFHHCSNLTSVMIGNSTTDIGSYAFTNCAINEINSLNPIPPMLINQNVFDNTVYMNATLNVPIGAGEAYKSADGWKNFWNIQEVDFASVGNIETNKTKVFGDSGKIIVTGVDNTKVEIFNTSGQLIYSGSDTTINVPTKGIYIVRVGGKTFKVSI